MSGICDSVLVTGSNRGIGLELVRQFAESPSPPSQVFAGCRDPDAPRAQCLRELAQKHQNVIIITLDTASQSSVSAASKEVGAKLKDGCLNLIINNAGMNIPVALADTSTKQMMDVYETNVVGPMLVAKEFLPYLQKAATQSADQAGMSCRRSAIINISSLLSSVEKCPETFSFAPMYPYRVSKAGLNMLTRCLSEDLRKDCILVMALDPGWVKTDMGGEQAPLPTADSAEGMLKVISCLTEKDTGTLLDWEGNSIPW